MENTIIGILAHVDAGKTTFSEQILYHAGVLRTRGRVDHGSAFLDAHPLERQRGITIFSDQAVFERDGRRFFWVDTPGHADFAAEMERAVSILDYAILIISGAEGIQSHTETIWSLLADYGVPTLIFINKTDRVGYNRSLLMDSLKRRLSQDVVFMDQWQALPMNNALIEAVAERNETLLDRLLEGDYNEGAWLEGLQEAIRARTIFPAYEGSALNDTGVAPFLNALSLLTTGNRADPSMPFNARIYKIRHDAHGARQCFVRILAGSVCPKDITILPGGEEVKINELRLYQGEKYAPLKKAEAGMLCAIPGLDGVSAGDHIGAGAGLHNLFRTQPLMAASVIPGEGFTSEQVLRALRLLEEEDPAMSVASHTEKNGSSSIDVQVMGSIQLEVLRQLLFDNEHIKVSFGPLRILYKETIFTAAIGIGHYEPLRHYAEVQLRLSPGPRGSGITFESKCHVDELALNWQRLIETHVFEKTHRGVLTGAPLTDVHIELLHGRSHLKHTEGGDFRQSTYRAIRNALMYARSTLLEPICRFTLRAPQESYGRLMGDLTRMQANLQPPVMESDTFTLTGEAPFSEFAGYNDEFMSLTHGKGILNYKMDHYAPCRDAQTVIDAAAYDPLADDTPDSVFCAHGAGFVVPWHEVRSYAHTPLEE